MRAVSPERYLWNTDVSVKYRDNETTTPVVAGVIQDYPIANNHYVGYGRFITETDFIHSSSVAVIGEDVRSILFPREDPLEKIVNFNGEDFVIVGVLEKKGNAFGGSNDNFFLIPFSTFDRKFPQIKNSGGDTIHIATVPYTPEQVPIIIEKGTALLRARRHVPFNKPNDFAIYTPDKLIESFQGITRRGHARDGVHRLHFAPDRRRGRHEHHARLGDRADARDRRAKGCRRVPAGHRHAVPDRGDHAVGPRRSDRGHRRSGRSRGHQESVRRRSRRRRRSGRSSSGCSFRCRSGSSSGSIPPSRRRGSTPSRP